MKKLGEEQPRMHDLVFLMKKAAPEPPDVVRDFIHDLNSVSVPTRYPDDLERMLLDYDKKSTGNVLKSTKEGLKWLKSLY